MNTNGNHLYHVKYYNLYRCFQFLFRFVLLHSFISSSISNIIRDKYNNIANGVQTICKLRQTCNLCVPIQEDDDYCVWSMSSSTCVHSTVVYKPGENLKHTRQYAGIISKFSRCSIETTDYKYLLNKRQEPPLHPSLTTLLEEKNLSPEYVVNHPGVIHSNGGLKLNLNWPVNGARASTFMPVSVGVEIADNFDATSTTRTCYELTQVGYSHLKQARTTSCYSMSQPIPAVKFPNKTGVYILRVWATVNPNAKDAQDGWRISNTKSIVIDKLRSEFYEDSIFSINDRFPGFPYDTWADDSNITMLLKNKLLKLNQQTLNRHVHKNNNNVLMLRREFHHWNKPIPRILHQIWWQGLDDLIEKSKIVYGEDMYNQPDWRRTNFLKWSETWKTHHPDWHYRLWDEPQIVKMIEDYFPDFLNVFNSFDALIKKIDFARYLIMFLYGGVYVDMDFEAFRPIDPLVFSSDSHENGYNNRYAGPSVLLSEEGATATINCAVLGSAPRHPFYWLVIHEVIRREDDNVGKPLMLDVLQSTGPVMLTSVAKMYQGLYPRSNMRILKYTLGEVELLYPFTADDLRSVELREVNSYECTKLNNCDTKFPNSFAMHHFSGSWWPNHVNDMEKSRQAKKEL